MFKSTNGLGLGKSITIAAIAIPIAIAIKRAGPACLHLIYIDIYIQLDMIDTWMAKGTGSMHNGSVEGTR